ncbi:TPA: DUF3265 domain-containing protein [Vibrio parahaemolyticus]|nr:DUF3265 domain-containing protein [Vibrio parahaemolyticus]
MECYKPTIRAKSNKRTSKWLGKSLTICLRAIRNARHFCNALRLVSKVVCGSFGIALLTP